VGADVGARPETILQAIRSAQIAEASVIGRYEAR